MSTMLQTIDDNRSPFASTSDNRSDPISASQSVNQITTEQALDAYVQADGNVHLAAERLFSVKVPNRLTLFMDLLAQDHVGLQRILRTRLILNMYTVFEASQVHLTQSLAMMEGEDIAKTFIGLANTLEKLTANQSNANVNINIHEYMMRMLPPEAREAFQILTAPPESVIKLSDD